MEREKFERIVGLHPE